MGYKFYNVQEGVYSHRSIAGRLLAAGMAVMFAIALSISLSASANSVTPSTNDENRTKGWAHVNATPQASGVEIEFVNPRAFASCFEYRTDGDTTQVIGANDNPEVTDGLYPFHCLNNNSRTETIEANNFVEIRMVFGAESDERFNWTRFDVLDTTAPAVPTNLHRVAKADDKELQCGDVTTRQILFPTWDDNTENDFSHYEYTSINADGNIGINARRLESNQFIHNWTPPMDGTNGFKVRSVDTAGNTSDWSDVCYITYDSVAPVASIVEPATDGEIVSGLAKVTGSVDGSEQNIKSHWFEIKDSNGDASYFYNMNTSELTWSFDWDTTKIEDGTYTIRYVATDKAGNRSDESGHVIRIVEVDNRADNKDECKDGGWVLGLSLEREFRNQGDCVSHFSSETQALRNPDGARSQNARR